MKMGEKEVRSNRVPIGTAHFPIYDSLNEASAEKGEEICLGFVNAQIRTNECNTVRATNTGKPSKLKLQMDAITSITPDELAAVVGDEDAVAALIAKKMAAIAAERAAATASDDGDDEGDE